MSPCGGSERCESCENVKHVKDVRDVDDMVREDVLDHEDRYSLYFSAWCLSILMVHAGTMDGVLISIDGRTVILGRILRTCSYSGYWCTARQARH